MHDNQPLNRKENSDIMLFFPVVILVLLVLLCPIYAPGTYNAKITPSLQLYIIVQQANLLARLERRQTNVRATIAAESVTECTVAARADLALDREINLGEVVGGELETGKRLVCLRTLASVLSSEALSQTA